jgi:TonB family protein
MSQTYDLLYFHSQTEPKSSGRYFGLSIALHTALAIASFFVVAPAMDNLKKEVITIELEQAEVKPLPPPPKSLMAPQGEKIIKTRGAKRVLAPAPSAPKHAELGEKIAGPVKKSRTSHSKVSQIKSHTGGGKAAVAKSAPSRAGVPETLEDIAAPVLDTDGVEAAQVGNLGDNEFENDFRNVDRSNSAAIAAEKAQMDEEAQQIADEKEAALKALADDNEAQAKAMEDALKATRTKNAATLAQMKATERAAAEKAARDREAAMAAAAAKNRGFGNGAPSDGRGHGDSGADQVSGTRAGIPDGIRSLDQLKQMPGNPKPQYSNEERLKRHQGQVIFYAYVTTAGNTSQFKMAQSTGFRNLDGKTLAALKKWRFYPGQEGWVEIPFKWDIKGGVQEMPTLLRRVGSR